MKINEKNLCVFATTPPYDLEGYLNKRGDVNKAWQKRYFVLKGNLLFYFEKKGDKEPLGLIILEGCIIELAEDHEAYSFQIVFNGNRTYILGSDSQESMEIWMKSLTCAGYEYKKLLLAELQRQLEEIEGSQKKQIQDAVAPVAPKPPPRRQNPFNRPAPPPPIFTSQDSSSSKTPSSATTTVSATATPANSATTSTTDSVPLINNSHNNNSGIIGGLGFNGGSGSCSGITGGTTIGGVSYMTRSNSGSIKKTTVIENPNEFTFRSVHDAFRKVIMDDMNEYRRKKEDSQKPLIEL